MENYFFWLNAGVSFSVSLRKIIRNENSSYNFEFPISSRWTIKICYHEIECEATRAGRSILWEINFHSQLIKVWSSKNYGNYGKIGNWHVNVDEVRVLCVFGPYVSINFFESMCHSRNMHPKHTLVRHSGRCLTFRNSNQILPFNANTLSNSYAASCWRGTFVYRPSSNINGLIWTHLKALMLATTYVIMWAADWLRFILHKLVYNQHRDAMDKWYNYINWWFIDFE